MDSFKSNILTLHSFLNVLKGYDIKNQSNKLKSYYVLHLETYYHDLPQANTTNFLCPCLHSMFHAYTKTFKTLAFTAVPFITIYKEWKWKKNKTSTAYYTESNWIPQSFHKNTSCWVNCSLKNIKKKNQCWS